MYLIISFLIFVLSFFTVQNDNDVMNWFNELNTANSNDVKLKLITKIEESNYVLSDSLAIELDYHKADILYLNSEYEKSFKLTKNVLKRFETKKYNSRVFITNLLRVKNLYKLNQLEEALQLMANLEKEAIQDKSEFYVLWAGIYYSYNDIENSLKYNIKAQNEALKYENNDALMKIYNLFAVNYAYNFNKDKAIEYYKKSFDLSKANNDDLMSLMILNNLSIQFTESKNYNKALDVLQRADSLRLKSNNKFLNLKTLILKAENLYFLKKYNEANVINDSVLKESQAIKNDDLYSSALTLKADILNAKSQNQASISIYKKAIEIGEKTNKDVLNASNYLKISKIYENSGNLSKALKYYKDYALLNEEINQQKNADKLRQIEIKSSLLEYQQKLDIKNKEIELLNLRDSKNNIRNYLYLFLIFGLGFFIYRQLRINKINKKNLNYQKEIAKLKEENLNNKISFANDQMTDFSLQIIEQNKLLELLKKRLNNLKQSFKSNTDFKEMNFMVNEALQVNKEKIKLNLGVDNTINDFLFNLNSKYPDLNEKEIQIISYLRLNYKSKQIAELLNINPQTVNNYRASIRSKFNLKKHEKLNEFLKNLN